MMEMHRLGVCGMLLYQFCYGGESMYMDEVKKSKLLGGGVSFICPKSECERE